ncbi:hypothetical protein BDK51DRAFT_36899 [Blyttiomyces helicus]|uniref:Uncharacterized protein n=1 Tax=Blyttiomyces helicus TaxID=388810 RepID=A0A4P9W0A0_9FUNG|nr:hypothetical protein BDK51DRAFT_36899 [Blyttiomyces helicus]|eukprot:RKO84098.1 hypothetical protein BDK51DRAFT_36899 [Blyttiomyces helicus]
MVAFAGFATALLEAIISDVPLQPTTLPIPPWPLAIPVTPLTPMLIRSSLSHHNPDESHPDIVNARAACTQWLKIHPLRMSPQSAHLEKLRRRGEGGLSGRVTSPHAPGPGPRDAAEVKATKAPCSQAPRARRSYTPLELLHFAPSQRR